MRSFVKLTTVDLGFDPSQLVIAPAASAEGTLREAADKQRYSARSRRDSRIARRDRAVTPPRRCLALAASAAKSTFPAAPTPNAGNSFTTLVREGYLPAMGCGCSAAVSSARRT
jgi:hypothetical protein